MIALALVVLGWIIGGAGVPWTTVIILMVVFWIIGAVVWTATKFFFNALLYKLERRRRRRHKQEHVTPTPTPTTHQTSLLPRNSLLMIPPTKVTNIIAKGKTWSMSKVDYLRGKQKNK